MNVSRAQFSPQQHQKILSCFLQIRQRASVAKESTKKESSHRECVSEKELRSAQTRALSGCVLYRTAKMGAGSLASVEQSVSLAPGMGLTSIPDFLDYETFQILSNNEGGDLYNYDIFEAWKDGTGHITKEQLEYLESTLAVYKGHFQAALSKKEVDYLTVEEVKSLLTDLGQDYSEHEDELYDTEEQGRQMREEDFIGEWEFGLNSKLLIVLIMVLTADETTLNITVSLNS